MSNVYIHAGLDDEVRVELTDLTHTYRVSIGDTTAYLTPAQAVQLRDALAAALNEPRTSGGTDVSG